MLAPQYGEFVFFPLSLGGGWDYAPGKEAARQMAEKYVEKQSLSQCTRLGELDTSWMQYDPTIYQTWWG